MAVFDADGEEEPHVLLLVPATITITPGASLTEEFDGIAGVRGARERGELRMLERGDADSPWREIPFTVQEAADGAVAVVVSVATFGDFALVSSGPRLRVVPLYAGWNVVVWDGADGAPIAEALHDVADQVDVIYQWVAETQSWRSHRPAAPPVHSAFDTFTRGATYWVRAGEPLEWTVVGGPLEPPAPRTVRLHARWTEVVWDGPDDAAIAETLGDILGQVEVIYQWVAETQSWRSYRPGAPAVVSAFDNFTAGGSYWIVVTAPVEWTVPLGTATARGPSEGGAAEDVSSSDVGISLEAVDDYCDMSDDFQGNAQVRWMVDGGRAPYEVWVNGELQVGESGVVDAQCAGLRWVDFRTWERTAENLPLTVVGTVIDRDGVRASDLLRIKRPPAGLNSPGNETQTFDGGVDTLTLELFAPRLCDAQVWGRYSRIPFADTGVDDVTMEVEWRVSGGQPPYTVYLAGGEFEGDSGTLRVQCRHFEDGALDSGWLSVMGFARDTEGAIGSGIVETFALARSASTPEVENYRMNGGRTYRFEGILMTIPDGLTIDVGERFGSYLVECPGDACTDPSCANSTNSNVCEAFFRVETLDGGVDVTFGYRTLQMHGRGRILEGWRDDRGVQTDSVAELEAMMDAWAESVGSAPDLSAARWLNPAPLRISAYADPLVCDPSFDMRPVDDVGFVHVVVAGGAWVPTGIELDGEVVALARGSGRAWVRVDCSREPGMQKMFLNVHDLGPQTPTSIVETTAEMNFLPPPPGDVALQLGILLSSYSYRGAFDPTAYCEPGGKAKIAWILYYPSAGDGFSIGAYLDIKKSTMVWIDGKLAVSRADPSQISVDYGDHWVDCPQELGLHTVVIEATDSGTPPKSARFEYLIRVVESHPSGLEWSAVRPDDYPE